jgi:hypothetical protein
LLAFRIGFWRSLMRPEAAGGVVAGLAYCAAIAIFAPDYVTKVVPVAYKAYLEYQTVPLLALIETPRTVKIAALFLVWALMRRRLEFKALGDVFAIAAFGAITAYLIQQKGWQYQFLPADVYFILLFGTILVDVFIRWTASSQRPPQRAFIASATALVSCLVVASVYYPIQSAKAEAHLDPDRVAVQQAILAALPAGTTISVVGPNYASIFDLLIKYRLKWGSRFEGFWSLEAVFNAETAAPGSSTRQDSTKFADVAQWTRVAADEDIRRWRPNLVLVERCDDPTISCGTSPSLRTVDMLQWFERDPTFRADWSDYVRCREIGYYDVWYLREDAGLCAAVAPVAAHPDRVQRSRPTG